MNFDDLDLCADSLLIYSEHPIRVLRDRSNEQGIDIRPFGLWYGVGVEWVERAERMGEWYEDTRYLYELRFDPQLDAILRVDTEDRLFNFARRFEVILMSGARLVDWGKVARTYDGVEFSPYLSHLAGRFPWYGDFEVPCGCVWNPESIAAVTLTFARK